MSERGILLDCELSLFFFGIVERAILITRATSSKAASREERWPSPSRVSHLAISSSVWSVSLNRRKPEIDASYFRGNKIWNPWMRLHPWGSVSKVAGHLNDLYVSRVQDLCMKTFAEHCMQSLFLHLTLFLEWVLTIREAVAFARHFQMNA